MEVCCRDFGDFQGRRLCVPDSCADLSLVTFSLPSDVGRQDDKKNENPYVEDYHRDQEGICRIEFVGDIGRNSYGISGATGCRHGESAPEMVGGWIGL